MDTGASGIRATIKVAETKAAPDSAKIRRYKLYLEIANQSPAKQTLRFACCGNVELLVRYPNGKEVVSTQLATDDGRLLKKQDVRMVNYGEKTAFVFSLAYVDGEEEIFGYPVLDQRGFYMEDECRMPCLVSLQEWSPTIQVAVRYIPLTYGNNDAKERVLRPISDTLFNRPLTSNFIDMPLK